MNFLRRAIAAQTLLPRYSSGKRLISLYPVPLLQHSSPYYTSTRTATTYTTTKYKYTPTRKSKTQPPSPSASSSPETESVVAEKETKVDWARPSEIPYQPKVSNSVNLIGHVKIPVQFKATEDGNYWAGTIIAQQHSSQPNSPPSLWIPVVFEGDLAHIANCHLKEKDYVYIAGQLCADQPPVNISQGQANVQVMAHSLHFVEGSWQSMKGSLSKPKELSSTQSQNPKVPNGSEPISLYSKETSNNAHQMKSYQTDKKRKKGNSLVGSWRDLLNDPKQWWDYRETKRNGLVKPKHPDFKHKESGVGLWLVNAPGGVLAGFERLDFNVIHVKDSRGGGIDDKSWKDLVENPDRWWDNRIKKVNTKSPDFKHKETGKALWLKSAPSWVLSSFAPLKSEQHDADGMDGGPWKDLVENPTKWWDNRSKKLNAKAPDFKHKETSMALWLSGAPAWALASLTPSKAKLTNLKVIETNSKVKETKSTDGDDWKDLVDNPSKWWDNRADKRNARAPDFKHKETGKVLWLTKKVPQWVLSSLPPLKA